MPPVRSESQNLCTSFDTEPRYKLDVQQDQKNSIIRLRHNPPAPIPVKNHRKYAIMLTTEHLRLHFRCLARLASWRMLPLEVNAELGRIRLWSSRKKQAQYLVLAVIFSLHLLYINLRTLESAFFDPNAPRFYLAWYTIVSCALTTYLSWHHVFFVQFPDIFITILDELLHPSHGNFHRMKIHFKL